MEMEPPEKRRRLHSFPSFTNLPDEIALQIFDYLDVVSKLRLRRVWTRWNVLLRVRDAFETIKLDVRWCETYLQLPERHDELHYDRSPPAEFVLAHTIVGKLWELWKGVKCIIIDYELTEDKSLVREYSFMGSCLLAHLVVMIGLGKHEGFENFTMLNTIVVRGVTVRIDSLSNLKSQPPGQFRLVIYESKLCVSPYVLNQKWNNSGETHVEFTVDRNVFVMSEEEVCLKNSPVLHILDDKDHPDFTPRLDRAIAQYIVDQCRAVKDEDVSQLGELYSTLLRGREGMVIRSDLSSLFKRIFELDGEGNPRAGFDPSRKHWEQCKGYDFMNLDTMSKFFLVYYSKPRNCYITRQSVDEDGDETVRVEQL